MNMPEALSRCLVMNTVAAARMLLRRYDTKLKPYGVTVQQFSLLAAIRFNQGEPVASLANKVALDRTSLTRNLDLLERKGLIRRVAANGNLRLCQLTEAGDLLLDRLLEEWKEAQSEMLSSLTADESEVYLRVARRLKDG
jgi:DNA-binding MarR family transcriptional regulator